MAAVTKTDIANLALSLIKDKHVLENVETDTSPQGRAARLWYDPARRQALTDMDLGFSRTRQTLATHSEAASADWTYRYQWPADCIHPRRVQNPLGPTEAPIPFDIELAADGSRSIVTDEASAVLIYTKDQENTETFPPHFVLALGYLIGHYIAGMRTGKTEFQAQLMQAYQSAIGRAGALEGTATAAGTQTRADAPWIKGR